MNKNGLSLRIKPYIQPFERELAFLEVRALAGVTSIQPGPNNHSECYRIEAAVSRERLASRLAYWETVNDHDGEQLTVQSLRESTVSLVRNGITLEELRALLPFTENASLPNRRCLRYGTHGIHEYRGKFFPQLVRSLVNISQVRDGAVVADPMCGSGTTIVESVLAGFKGRGVDLNPLSVMLARAKTQLLCASPSILISDYNCLREQLTAVEPRGKRRLKYFDTLPSTDQDYLRSWFSGDVLGGLDDISQAIAGLQNDDSTTLARVALSNIVRSVSWQKDDDLRVRKEIRLNAEIDPKKEFLEEMDRSIRAVLALLYQNGPLKVADFEIREGDARDSAKYWGKNSVDVFITSPPYATALPYLDTDRLSLCYLRLLPRPEHRARDQAMIGNREVTERLRRAHWTRYKECKQQLPAQVRALIEEVQSLNSKIDVGFRRRNLPALLAKYFFDMKDVIESMMAALKPGHFAFVVVGNNHTLAGGQHIDIMTAPLLQDIARDVGFDVGRSLAMEMLVSRDIFRKNATASEEILTFQKPWKSQTQK